MRDLKDKSLPILFVSSFVQAVLIKVNEYKKQTSVLSKPVDKHHSALETVGTVAGAAMSMIAGSGTAGKDVGAKVANYHYSNSHKDKAKTVLHRFEDNVARHLYQPSESDIFKQMVSTLIEGGVEVIRSFEYQLHQIWYEEDPPVRRNMEKVAVDAADRFIDFLHVGAIDESEQLNYKTVLKGVLIGKSKSPFGLSLKKKTVKKTGRTIDSNANWNTNEMFELTKVVVSGRDVEEENGVYIKMGKEAEAVKYGARPASVVEYESFEEMMLNGVYQRQKGNLEDFLDGFTFSTERELDEVAQIVQTRMEASYSNFANMHTLPAALREGSDSTDSSANRIVVPPSPKPDQKCVKRKDLIEEALSILRLETTPLPILVFHGFGGFGKTQLAKMLIEEVEAEYDACIWINHETAEADVQNILQLNQVEIQIGSSWLVLLTKFYDLLKGKKVLLVLDNITSEKELIQRLSVHGSASSLCRDFTVLITSRKEVKLELLGIQNVHNIRVSFLEEQDAEAFAKSSLTVDGSELNGTDLKELIRLSEKIPLTLATMCATIRWTNMHKPPYTIENYLEDLKNTKMGNDVFFYGDEEDDHLQLEYQHSLRKSMDVAVNQILKQKYIGSVAIELFDKIVYGPLVKQGISGDLIYDLPSIRESVEIALEQPRYSGYRYLEIIKKALTLLDQFSVLNLKSTSSVILLEYDVNPILAAVRQYMLQAEKKEEGVLREILILLPKLENGLFPEVDLARSTWKHAAHYPELCKDFFLERGSLLDLTEGGVPSFLKKILEFLGPEKAVAEILRQQETRFWFPSSPMRWTVICKNTAVFELYCDTILQCQSVGSIEDVDVFGELVIAAVDAVTVSSPDFFAKILRCFGSFIGDTSELYAEVKKAKDNSEDYRWIKNRVATHILEQNTDIPWSFNLAVYASVLNPELFVNYYERNEVNIGADVRREDQTTLYSALKMEGRHPDVISYILPKLEADAVIKILEDVKNGSDVGDEQQDATEKLADDVSLVKIDRLN